ncbi:MAG: hypothetical protein A3I04_01910 [Nitrospinae bacterium RIFCSPLOWO2_02_FULL_39_110]|nr:MAG: hypothetical protein A3D97_01505 [Nitrospinae bacterium RIFCSPHIGHO2_12_FULL_39_42]OGW01661.1 MAG: hypothetical protein A3D20_05455 [Nitrospinae bacterium RIFCSPHIGHO2_02_FULL_39_82]OGW02562.1 MAG: hypothetical protein A2Z59_12655 [Nitrospinae bacterium RIFCSPLOWO2_02_39_17]OGW04793.1 MAG: hypothetical protein A3I04_01910 [Nitrospinae bacterium RIFCSPLOWO2_02_FULL_39_110]HLA47737.1 hypothetical protein [Nitrospinota bacterium]
MSEDKSYKSNIRHWDCELRHAFLSIPEKEIRDIFKEIYHAAKERNFTYEREGRYDVINLLPLPLVASPEQVRYLHKICLIINSALSKLTDLYLKFPEIRKVIPMTEEEERWIKDVWTGKHKNSPGIWNRLDFHFDIYHPYWKDTITFFENNSVAVGGNHYVPVAEELITNIVLPRLKRVNKNISLKKNNDIHDLLYHEIIHHAKAIGRKRLNIAFVEDKTLTSGITEFPSLAEFYNKKIGKRADIRIYMIDPRELHLKDDEVYYKNHGIDIIYRDFELLDLFKMGKGEYISAMKTAFKKNQVISGIAGEFDHKACWEVLRDKRYSTFLKLLRTSDALKYIPWTKVIRDIRTESPSNENIELLNYASKNKDSLVLKPNRGYGGYGIAIGRDTTRSHWDEMIDRGCREHGKWIVQEYKRVSTKIFPSFDEKGDMVFEEFHTVYGLAGTSEGLGILGRASKKEIVNVAQRGGIVAVLRAQENGN